MPPVRLLLALLLTAVSVEAAVIHGTDAEIALWQARRTDPAFQDEWQPILSRANQFASRPEGRYAGNTTGRCYTGALYHLTPSRTQDAGMRDAGFAYLLTKDTRYLGPVRDALLAQTRVRGTQFGDGQRWCDRTGDYHGYGDNISPWLRRVAYAYSYVRDALAPQDRQQIEGWLRDAGQHLDAVVQNVTEKRFPNRLQGNYNGGCRFGCQDVAGLTHAGGERVHGFHEAWNNKGASMTAAVAVIGTLVRDRTLQDHAARFVQEWVKYGVYAGGQIHDQFRWSSGGPGQRLTPQHGYLYSGESLGSIITAVDVLARAGHSNLYEYSTSDGALGTEGGTKSLRTAMRHFAALTTGAVKEYASHGSTNNANLLIDSDGPIQRRIEYVVLAQGNRVYQDPLIRQAVQRPFPARWTGSGCDMRGGDWCTLPDARFMFADMPPSSGPEIGPIQPLEPPQTDKQLWAAWAMEELGDHAPPEQFILTVEHTGGGPVPPPMEIPWGACVELHPQTALHPILRSAEHCAPIGCPPNGTYRFWVQAEYEEGLSGPSNIAECRIEAEQCVCATGQVVVTRPPVDQPPASAPPIPPPPLPPFPPGLPPLSEEIPPLVQVSANDVGLQPVGAIPESAILPPIPAPLNGA